MNVLHGTKIEGRKPKLKYPFRCSMIRICTWPNYVYNVLWHAAEEKERSLKT